jgi:hypothetical protein
MKHRWLWALVAVSVFPAYADLARRFPIDSSGPLNHPEPATASRPWLVTPLRARQD